jgi:alpha-D-xyloside xylohydrolase
VLLGDGWALAALDGGALVLSRGTTEQLRLERNAWLVGTVTGPLDDTLSYDPYWLFVSDGVFSPVSPPGLRWHVPSDVTVQRATRGATLALTYDHGLSATVSVSAGDDGHPVLRFVPTPGEAPIAYLRVKATVDATEAFYGLGEFFDGANHRGKLRALQLEADLTLESASSENHVVTPFVFGSRGWGLFVESDRLGVVDVAKSASDVIDGTWGTAEASGDGLTLHLFSAADALDIPGQYFRVAGFPHAPPEWALGPWLWRNETRDQAELMSDVKTLRALDLATTGLWLDRPYASAVNTFDLDPAKFPDAGALPVDVAAAGLKLAVWHTPYLEPGAEPFRSQAEAGGFFPLHQGTWLNKWSAPIDFTNPAADAFWQANVQRYTRAGVEGFKLDFAEDIVGGLSGRGSGWRFFDGSTERTMHAGYTRRYHHAYAAALGHDGFLLVRNAKWGEQALGVIVWPGDIDATLTSFGEAFMADGKQVIGVGGLPSAIRAGVGLSLCGFNFAADTGGYRHSPPSKETFVRWVQQSALMPVMQTGDSSSQPPWVFTPENGRDDEALGVYRQYARLHLRLFPYFYSQLKRLEAGLGRPIVRPYGLAFPSAGVFPEDVYVLGDELLVAPVERAGLTRRAVPVPAVRHESWWTGATLDSGEVDAPLTQLPLFVREGALVPMLRPTIDTLAPTTDATVDSFAQRAGDLWVRVVPSTSGSRFELYDGALLTQRQEGAGLTLGATAGRVFSAGVVWELARAAPAQVSHAGAALTKRASFDALDAAGEGWAVEGAWVRVKHPLDGAPTVVQ